MERPLEKIRDINNSLHRIASKIQILNRERLQDTQKIDKIVEMAIPKIKYKLNDAHFQSKKQRGSEVSLNILRDKIVQTRERKKMHQLTRSRSIQNVKQSRMQSSKELRELSRLNEERIRNMKLKVIEEKRRKKEQIQQTIEKSRKSIQNFHIQKKSYLRYQRDEEKEKSRKKLQELARNINHMQSQKNRVLRDRLAASNEYEKMKKTFIRINRMKLSEFQQVSDEANFCGQDLNAQEAEYFMRYINEKENAIKSSDR